MYFLQEKPNQTLKVIRKTILVIYEAKCIILVCFVCRRGNDSQLAAVRLKKELPQIEICDMKGGLHGWAKAVDSTFPVY